MADISKYFDTASTDAGIGKFFDPPVPAAPAPPPPAPKPGLKDYARLGFRGLVREAPLQAASTIAGMIEGPEGVEPTNPDIGDKIRGFARESGAEYQQDVQKTLGGGLVPEMFQAIPSLGYSAATLPVTAAATAAGTLAGTALGGAAGLPTGPGALTTAGAGAAGGFTAGLGASYMAMDRAAQAQILGDLAAQEEQRMGRAFTEPEFAAFKADLDKKVAAYGGWEAGPEALSNVIDLAILRRVPGASVLTGAAKKLLGIAATELPTETITQIGQSQALEGTSQARPEGALSFRSPKDIGTAAREVLPGVLVVGGGMTVANVALEAVQNKISGQDDPETRDRALDLLKFKAQNPTFEVTDEAAAEFLGGKTLTGEAPVVEPVAAVEPPVTREETLRRERRAAQAPTPTPQGEPVNAMPPLSVARPEARQEVQEVPVQGGEVTPSPDVSPAEVAPDVSPVEPLTPEPEKETPNGQVQTQAAEEVTPVEQTLPETPGQDRETPKLTQAIFTESSNSYISFDSANRVPTKQELEEYFNTEESPLKVVVIPFQKNIVSATQGVNRYRLEFWTKDGRIAKDAEARQVFEAKMGTSNFSAKSALEEALPFGDRFGTVVDTVKRRMSGVVTPPTQEVAAATPRETKSVNPLTVPSEQATLPEKDQGGNMRQEPKVSSRNQYTPIEDYVPSTLADTGRTYEIGNFEDDLYYLYDKETSIVLPDNSGKYVYEQGKLVFKSDRGISDSVNKTGFKTVMALKKYYESLAETNPKAHAKLIALLGQLRPTPTKGTTNATQQGVGVDRGVVPTEQVVTKEARIRAERQAQAAGIAPTPERRAAKEAKVEAPENMFQRRRAEQLDAEDTTDAANLMAGVTSAVEKKAVAEIEETLPRLKGLSDQVDALSQLADLSPDGSLLAGVEEVQRKITDHTAAFSALAQGERAPVKGFEWMGTEVTPPMFARKFGKAWVDGVVAEVKALRQLANKQNDSPRASADYKQAYQEAFGVATLPAPTLPALKRGYKRSVFTVADPGYKNYTFVEETDTKGRTTLTARKAGETEFKPTSKAISDKVMALPRVEAKFSESFTGKTTGEDGRAIILVDPTKAELRAFLKATNTGRARVVKDPETGAVYVADAGLVTHDNLAYRAGVPWASIMGDPDYMFFATTNSIDSDFSKIEFREEQTSASVDPIADLTKAIADETGQPVPQGTFTQVAPPKGQEALFAALAKTLKKEIVFFKNNGAPMSFNGATGISEGVIFVNIDAAKPHLVVAGHEFLHDLKAEDPESYASLRDVVMETIPAKQRQDMMDRLNAKRSREGRQVVDMVAAEEELVADFFGEQFTSKEFWAKVERRNPEGFAGLVQKLVAFLEKIKAALTGSQREDVERAQTAAAEALARYIEKNPDAAYELRFAELSAKLPAFFSQLDRVVGQKMGGRMPVVDLKKMLKNNGVTDAEITQLIGGLSGVVTKQQVVDEIAANTVAFEDVVLGAPVSLSPEEQAEYDALTKKAATKKGLGWKEFARQMELKEKTQGVNAGTATHFNIYVEPGAVEGSYRELFVTAPQKPDALESFGGITEAYWKSLSQQQQERIALNYGMTPDQFLGATRGWQDGHSQYSDISNPIVRVRFNTREVDGKTILFVEEMQGPNEANQQKMPEYLRKRIYDIGVKRVLAYAQENGFDGVAWTTGEMQAARYDLSKQIDDIIYRKDGENDYFIGARKDGKKVLSENMTAAKLEETVGKEVAQKIVDNVGEDFEVGGVPGKRLSGLDLKVGGEGLKDTYDVRLPKLFKTYGKAEVGRTDVEGKQVPFMPLTAKTPVSFPQFSELGTAPKTNLARIKDSLLSGQVKTQALPSVLKLTPLSIVADFADAIKLTGVRTFAKITRQRNAVSNGIITDFGLKARELAATKESAQRINDVAEVATLYQMKPQDSIYEQDWMRGAKEDLIQARAAAVLQGYEKTGKIGTTTPTDAAHARKIAEAIAAKEVADPTKEQMLKSAQYAWEQEGMQKDTGKTFREAYLAARQVYDGLETEELKTEYILAVDMMKAVRQRKKNASQALIEEYTQDDPNLSDAERAEVRKLRADQIAKLDFAYNNLKGNYWPLYRSGEYTLDYVEKDTGKRGFETYHTVFEREIAARGLVESGKVDESSIKLSMKSNTPKGSFGVPQGYNIALGKAIEDKAIAAATQGIDPKNTEEMERATALARQSAQGTIQTLHQVWLSFQPESSTARNMLRRKNIRGYDTNMIRGFLEYGQTHAVSIAQMEQGRKIEKVLNEMAQSIRSKSGDTTRDMAILNDLRDREAVKSVPSAWLTKKFGAWTTFRYMTSPSIMLVQLSQLGILTLPKLATLKGSTSTKAASALSQGIADAFSPKFSRAAIYGDQDVQTVFEMLREVVTPSLRDRFPGKYDNVPLGTPVFTEDEMRKHIAATLSPYQQQLLALHEAMDRGLLDISLSHEVNEQIDSEGIHPVTDKIFNLGMTFMRESEKASRKAAILAAFEVGGGPKDFFAGMDTVEEVVVDTLLDFSKSNKGVALQGNVLRMVSQFQTFRINVLGRLLLLFRQSIKGESPEVKTAAKKELIGIFGMSGILAGALGVPFGPAAFALFDAILGDDDDEPSEVQFNKWLAQHFGQTAADVAIYGLPSLLGMYLSRRIGLGDIASTSAEMPVRLVGDGALNWWATQAAGPSYSMVAGYAKGFNEIFNEGEVIKGLISSTPKPVGDALKAYGYATGGVKTGMGKRLLAADQVGADDVLLQAVGFAPLEINRLKSKEFDVTNRNTRLAMKWGQIKQDLVKAYVNGESTDEEREAMLDFVTKYPGFVRSPGTEINSAMREHFKKEAGLDTPRETWMKNR